MHPMDPGPRTKPKQDLLHTVGGDFQASPAPNIQGNARILRELLRGQLIPLNDPLIPTFQPANSPVDHWLTRRGDKPLLPVQTLAIKSHHSDHSSLVVQIPAESTEHDVYEKPHLPRYSTRRPDTQFQFPLSGQQIREYQAGTVEIEQSIHETAEKMRHLTDLPADSPDSKRQIDEISTSVMDTLNSYLELAKTIWPAKQEGNPKGKASTNTKRHLPPLNRSQLRQLYRLTGLRNAARTEERKKASTDNGTATSPARKPTAARPQSAHHPQSCPTTSNSPTLPVRDGNLSPLQHATSTTTNPTPSGTHEYEYEHEHKYPNIDIDNPIQSAARTLNLEYQPKLHDIPSLCRNEIATIIKTANKKADRKETDRANKAYDVNPKQVHRNIKVASGLMPRSQDLPSLYGIRKQDGTVTTDPAEVLSHVESHFNDELRTATPAELPHPPWENPDNPDNFKLDHPYHECADDDISSSHTRTSASTATRSGTSSDTRTNTASTSTHTATQEESQDTRTNTDDHTPNDTGPRRADETEPSKSTSTRTGTDTHTDTGGAHNLLNYANYVRTVTRLATGKAPGPDGIPNEVLRYLPDRMHSNIFGLFLLLAKHSYTPPSWSRSVTCLLFKHGKPDPMNPACYRPIALMNCILKLWTGTIQNALSAYSESRGIIRDSQDGFRALRKIYDSLTTHISMLEDAKLHKRDIYTCYIDFKSAFNGTDHRLLFKFMKDLGLPQKLITICQQIYGSSTTAYATPYGLTRDLQINRGTLQGDTLSPFLFTIFLEPLLRWLQIGSRGYKPHGMGKDTGHNIHMTYDDHGYADDISITTGTLEDMKIQLRKIQLFSSYTGLELQIQKCEVTGALWSRGSPMSKENLRHLKQQINTIELLPGRKVKFLPPNSSYKVLGVHVNHMLNFRDHFQATTKDVRKLIRTLQNFKLSGGRKIQVIDRLLLAKYHAMHLGIFTEQQLTVIDSMINSAVRKAKGLTPSFPTQAMHAGRDTMGIGRPSVKERAAYLATKHLVAMMNKPTQRGQWIYNHVNALIKQFGHWPKESLNNSKYSNLPTLRVLTYINDAGITLRTVPPLLSQNEIAHTIGLAMDAVDETRWNRFITLSDTKLDDAAYTALRKETQPLHARKMILSHLAPMWHLTITTWTQAVTRTVNGDIRMLGNSDILKRAPGSPAPTDRPAAHKNLNTLRALLQLPADTGHRTLPNAPSTTMDNSVPCHPTWKALIDPYVPEAHSTGASRTAGYQMLAAQAVRAASKKRTYAQQYEDHMVLAPRQLPPCDVRHISDRRRTITLQTQFLVHWAPEYLTKQDVADQIQLGFESVEIGAPTGDETTNRRKKLKPPRLRKCKLCGNPLAGDPSLGGLPITHCSSRNCHVAIHTTCSQHHPEWQCSDCIKLGVPPHHKIYHVQWAPSWQSEQAVQTMPSGPKSITRYKQLGKRARNRLPHYQAGTLEGWHPILTTFSTHAINPDLDIKPTGKTEIIQHHTKEDLCVLIRPDGTAAATLPDDTVQNLYTRLYRPQATAHTFPEEVASLVARTPLSTAVRALNQNLLDSLLEAFDAKRILHTNPLLVPITDRTVQYHSPHPKDNVFSALPDCELYVWTGTSVSIPQDEPHQADRALSHAIYSAHATRDTSPSCTVLVLPDRPHSSYLNTHLAGCPYCTYKS